MRSDILKLLKTEEGEYAIDQHFILKKSEQNKLVLECNLSSSEPIIIEIKARDPKEIKSEIKCAIFFLVNEIRNAAMDKVEEVFDDEGLGVKTRIKRAIEELGLSKEELDLISIGNMDRICESARVDKLELMYYLRFER